MTSDLSPIERAKFVAAKRAVDFVQDGMKLGLGTGSTAAWVRPLTTTAQPSPKKASARP